MQKSVDDDVRPMRFHRFFLLFRFTVDDGGGNDHVAQQARFFRQIPVAGEGEDVGRVILAAIVAVQLLHFVVVNEADGQLQRFFNGERCACGFQPALQAFFAGKAFIVAEFFGLVVNGQAHGVGFSSGCSAAA